MTPPRPGALAGLYGTSIYRNDIQGLRALGALIIMAFHIWASKVSGGVDIFIVVSGFLMTSLLLRGWLTSGTKFTFDFWSKIIVRIAPSAYLVLLTTVIIGYYVLPPATVSAFIDEAIAAALHLENWMLVRRSVDYLASDIPASPLQQFWALSVQVQFYAVLPFLLIPLAFFSRRMNTAKPLVAGFALLLVLSFMYATHKVAEDPVGAYFNTFARGWEFLAGGVLFLLSPLLKLSRRTSMLLAILGILLVLCSAFLVPGGALYPGPVALIPVAAAILIIVSGVSGVYQSKLLSSKVMVFLGGFSFTIYLWHWPVLIFYKEMYRQAEVSLLPGLAIIIISIALAYITQKIEVVVKRVVGKKVLYGYVAGILCLIPVGVGIHHLKSEINDIRLSVMAEWQAYDFSVQTLDNGIYEEYEFTEISRQELISARDHLPESYSNNCHQGVRGSDVITCDYGDVAGDKTVVLVGGSHALQWLPALGAIGARNGFKIVSMTKAACMFGPAASANASCHRWNMQALQTIIDLAPDLVVTNSTRAAGGLEIVPDAYVESWRRVTEQGIPLLGIRDNPWFHFDVPECIARNPDNHLNCSVKRSEHLAEINPALQYSDLIYSMDMTEYICTEERCPVTFNGHLMYRDRHHIHVPYVSLMTNVFEAQMRRVYPTLFE